MSHTKTELFLFFFLCIFVSVTYKCKKRNFFSPKRSIEAIKLWINKLDILVHQLQNCSFNCRICDLLMMLSRENTA